MSRGELLPSYGIVPYLWSNSGNDRNDQEIATVESEHEDRFMSNLQQWASYTKVVELVLGVDDT
jgi:hypothetical protein